MSSVNLVARAGSEPEDVRSRSLLRPAILLLLHEREGHGYELMGRLAELGVEVPPTTGGLYRSLRAMADERLISSYWSTPERGPARRVYSVTEHGEQHLEQSMPALASLLRTVRGMLNRYGSGT
jgi:PadR family transcriptional regulator PadR